MNNIVGLIVIAGVLGTFAMLATYSIFSQRRRLSSGQLIGHFIPENQAGEFVFDNPISVTLSSQWCRLLLTLKSAGDHEINQFPHYFFKKIAFLVGTPYSLTLKNAKGHIVHHEASSLAPLSHDWAAVSICRKARSMKSHMAAMKGLSPVGISAGEGRIGLVFSL